jgi:hypothetical protein
MQVSVAVTVEERFDFGRNIIPTLLESGFTNMFGYGHICRI